VQVIGVKSFELPGSPLGVDREIIGQLPSGFWVATRKSMPRWISHRYDGGQTKALRYPYHNERALQEAILRSRHQCPARPVRRRHGHLPRRVRLSAGTLRTSVTSTCARKAKSPARSGPTHRSTFVRCAGAIFLVGPERAEGACGGAPLT